MNSTDKRTRDRWIVATVLVAVAVALCYFFIDRPVARWVNDQGAEAMHFWHRITDIGQSHWFLVPAAVLFIIFTFIRPRPLAARKCAFMFLAVAVAGLLNLLLKVIFGRYRPSQLFEQEPRFGFGFFDVGYHVNSFPSGHACTVGAVAAVLWTIAPRLRALWVVLALVLAASRVLTRSHYVGDTIAGAFVGVVVAMWVGTWWKSEIRNSNDESSSNVPDSNDPNSPA